MKLVYAHENRMVAHNVKNLLEQRGIEVVIKNEYLQGAAGELSAFDAWPEVWLVDESQYERAGALIEAEINSANSSTWFCRGCKEENDASFEICWQCQREKD